MEKRDAIRLGVTSLAGYSPLAREREYTADTLAPIQESLQSITPPLTLDEARTLLPLLDRESEDDLYGLIWTLVALLETAPGWPPTELNSLANPEHPWFEILKQRATRAHGVT
jgi:hypothetical protein